MTVNTTTPPAVTADHVQDTATERRWRAAGAFGLGYVVLIFGAIGLEGTMLEHGTSPAKVQQVLSSDSVTGLLHTTYVEAMSFVVLVPAIILFARLFARGGEVAKVGAESFRALMTAYVAATFAIGWAPLLAATYAAHHGADPTLLATVNDLRNYSFILQVALNCAAVLALGIAAIASRTMTKWAGYVGVAGGAIFLVVTPFAQNAASMFTMVWWLGLCILALRGGPKTR